VIIKVDLTGNYRTNIYTAARALLTRGASPSDTIETWRDGKLSMSGNVGECAKLKVEENKDVRPTFSLRRWRPFAAGTGEPEMASEENQVCG
jgi:hypothetical protein